MPINGAGDGRSDSGGIPVPPTTIRAFLKLRGICAIARTADNRIVITRDLGRLPRTAVAVWWGNAHTVLSIRQHLARHGGLDIPTAAAQLRLSITAHGTVIGRASSAVDRIERALDQARRTGKLAAFNRAYAALHRQARAEGRKMPPYGRCYARLRQELFKASSGTIDAGIIERALLG